MPLSRGVQNKQPPDFRLRAVGVSNFLVGCDSQLRRARVTYAAPSYSHIASLDHLLLKENLPAAAALYRAAAGLFLRGPSPAAHRPRDQSLGRRPRLPALPVGFSVAAAGCRDRYSSIVQDLRGSNRDCSACRRMTGHHPAGHVKMGETPSLPAGYGSYSSNAPLRASSSRYF